MLSFTHPAAGSRAVIWICFASLLALLSSPLHVTAQARRNGAAPAAAASATTQVIPGMVVFKLKPVAQRSAHPNTIDNAALQQALARIGATGLTQQFPRAVAAAPARAARGEGVDLTLIYRASFSAQQPLEAVRQRLLATGAVEYATPLYARSVFFQPNDPMADSVRASAEYHLKNIRAYRAWDVEQGDSSVVIGIVDTGTLFSHEDLAGRFAYNYADPINGQDDDHDGYVDNFCGWDMADNDGMPAVDDTNVGNPQPKHGALVSGVVAARVNNGKGVAGVGFNCRIMPIKVFATEITGHFAGFEGIVYAADHGCKVINCSWGGDGFYSPYEQDLITYATVNRDAVVVAAAGNTPADLDFYPASYKGVLAVAATDANDVKGASNTWSHRISLSAPGKQVYTTHYINDTTYVPASGSSFASPIVAATVALVRSHFPNLTAEQAAERVRMTADASIYNLAGNANYPEMLGRGRVNAFRAVTEADVRSVRVVAMHSHRPHPGANPDTVLIQADFRNYLAPLQNLTVNMTSPTPKVQVLPGATTQLGALNTLETAQMSQIFRLVLQPDTTPYRLIQLRFGFSDASGYTDYQYVKVAFDSAQYVPPLPRAVVYYFSPTSGEAGTQVTINGYNFTGARAVKFNGTPATSFTVVSTRQVKATVPAGATTGPVSVTNPYGTAVSYDPFTVLVPVVSSFAPASGGPGAVVTVTGNYLGRATGVTLNGTPVPSFTVVSATALTFVVPAGATMGKISVASPSGMGTSSGSFQVLMPKVSGFNPTSGAVGTLVTVAGANFGDATTVVLNGAVLPNFTVVSATSISFVVPVGATSGQISVTSSTGTGTSTGTFVVLAPRVMSFSPSSGLAGTMVTVTGAGFVGVSGVSLGGVAVPSYTVVSATSLTFLVPAGATSGVVSVSTAAGAGISTATFAVLVPKVSSFSPTAAVTGANVTVTGSNFAGATSLTVNGVAVPSFAVVSATSITFSVPAGVTSGIIGVTTPTGTGTSTGLFKVLPTISGFTPANGEPGTVITITGTGLKDVASITFNGLPASAFTEVNSTTLNVKVPELATTGKLAVTTTGGLVTTTAAFTVAPIITELWPAQGAVGSIVLVQGLNFVSGTTVLFNGVAATTTYNSATQLTATVPAGAATGSLMATNPSGTGTSPGSFTVVSGTLAKITSFTPTTNVVAGTSITITGTGFTGATAVRFNNVDARVFSVNSATCITALVPAGATTGKLYVTTATGTGQSGSSLTIMQPATISSLAPASGAVGTVVTLTGTNFTGATQVLFGGVAAPVFTVSSATKITVTVPLNASSGNISVTTPAGTATSATGFAVNLLQTRPGAPTASAVPATLDLYPNPATADAAVWAQFGDQPAAATVEIFDATGRRVRTTGFVTDHQLVLPIGGLPAGTYVVRCGTASKRLILTQ